jgi:O-antigen ligase
MAFVAVVAVYLVQQVGWKGLLAAGVLVAPAVLLGGRSGNEADSSAMERLEAWSAGMSMFKSSPIWGIGKSQFLEYHVLTAHNTLMLEAAELGLVGMVLWAGVLYTGFKITLSAIRRYGSRPDTALASDWARALLASLCGIAVGTSFLSLGYHPLVWTFLALPGAYYLTVRRRDPEFQVVFGARDLLAVTGFAIVYLVGVQGYLLVRGV